MKNNDLRRKKLNAELKRIMSVLQAKYAPEEVILFGSLAKGKILKNSDIDLVIVKKTKKRFVDRIGEVIKICKPKIAVDFIVYTPQEFSDLKEKELFIQQEVIREGKVLYERA